MNDFLDFEFNLEDRIAKIKSIVKQYGEDNLYVSFSGGKDSVVLSELIDLAIPNNKIPRIYNNTGIEYPQIVEFVKNKVNNDERFSIIPPSKNIKQTLLKVGMPFKSKEHSGNLNIYRNNIDLCEKYKNDETLIKIQQMLKTQNKIYDKQLIDYVENIPSGAKTFIKYWFGIRHNKPKNETHDSVIEREFIYYYECCP